MLSRIYTVHILRQHCDKKGVGAHGEGKVLVVLEEHVEGLAEVVEPERADAASVKEDQALVDLQRHGQLPGRSRSRTYRVCARRSGERNAQILDTPRKDTFLPTSRKQQYRAAQVTHICPCTSTRAILREQYRTILYMVRDVRDFIQLAHRRELLVEWIRLVEEAPDREFEEMSQLKYID